jgi:tyrosine-protein kinase Etk/Wzc
LNLLDYVRILRKYRFFISGFVVIATILTAAISVLVSETYKARAAILPLVTSESSKILSSLSPELMGLGKMLGATSSFNTSDTLLAVLKSRTLTEEVIRSLNLLPVLFEKKWDRARHTWKNSDPSKQPTVEDGVKKMKADCMSFLEERRNPTIQIEGIFKDPVVAADVVNGYVKELQLFINKNTLTTAKRKRIFIQEQLTKHRAKLLLAGKELDQFYAKNRTSSVRATMNISVSSLGLADDLDERLRALSAENDQISKKLEEVKQLNNIPQNVYYAFLDRQFKILNEITGLLTNQLEMARIEEAKETPAFQTIDRAVVPVRRYAPKRFIMVSIAFLASLLVSILAALGYEYVASLEDSRNT